MILLIAFGLPTLRTVSDFKKAGRTPTTKPSENAVDLQTMMMGKYLIGAAHALPQTKPQLIPQVEALNKVPKQEVSVAVLLGEVDSKTAAIERLAAIEGDGEATAFRHLYEKGTPLPESVKERYPFIADVAESNGKPDGDPQRAKVLAAGQRTFLTIAAAGVIGVGVGVLAFGLFITAIVLISLGKVRPNVAPPQPREGSLYVQGFAIYLGFFVFTSIALVVFEKYRPDVLPDALKYVPIMAAFVLGVTWPVLRGASFGRLREDWGLHSRYLIVEPIMGMLGYLAGLPLVGLGLAIMLGLQRLTRVEITPPIDPREVLSHPLQMLLLAVVWAPITEELMFRGSFLSHLRLRFNPWVSAVICGVVFAAIHPQGWAAIPLLGSIGFVLAMVRQWRKSIAASMAAHALNNGAITVFLLMAAG